MKITQEIIHQYTHGRCGYLASAIAMLTGWSTVGINGNRHWAVRTPDGLILDITGLTTDEEMMQRWDTDYICNDDEENSYWINDGIEDAYMEDEEGTTATFNEASQLARIVLDVYGLEYTEQHYSF